MVMATEEKKLYMKEYYKKNKENIQIRRKEYWVKQKEIGFTQSQKLSKKKASAKWLKNNYHKIRLNSIKNNRKLSIEHKQELVKLLGGKCEMCGYNKCQDALDFHHKTPEDKRFSISSKMLCNIDKLKKR